MEPPVADAEVFDSEALPQSIRSGRVSVFENMVRPVLRTLEGNFYSSKLSKDEFEKGTEYLEQAIKLDPDHALAYNGPAYIESSKRLRRRNKGETLFFTDRIQNLPQGGSAVGRYGTPHEPAIPYGGKPCVCS